MAYSFIPSFAQKPVCGEKKVRSNIEDHITYLASDALEGRATGSQGEYLSANYIVKHFDSLGLDQVMKDGYYQYMMIPTLRMAQPATSMFIDKEVYTLFTDFFPLSPSANEGHAFGELVTVGYGIEDEKNERNDYDSLDVKGKVVAMNIGLPGGTHPHNKFIAWAGLERRIEHAKSKGAVAVLFYATEKNDIPSGELAKTAKNAGIPVLFVNKPLPQTGLTNIELDIMLLSTAATNVVGFVDNGADYTVVIGAHHDHLGRGEISGSLAEKAGEIHNGADDNASGVAAMLELARIVKQKRWKYRKNNYLFVAFTGEEMGLLGSKYFVDHSPIPMDSINYMVNLDMVGHMDSSQKTIMINGVGTSPVWNKAIAKTRYTKKKIANIKTTEGGIGASDHTSFYLNGVPSVHFFTGQHEHYHKPSDDVEIVNMNGTTYVTWYISKYLRKLNKMGKAEYVKTKDENQGRRKFSVTLGVMPDYVYDGEGMRIDGVKEGRPGHQAGLVKGDVVKTLNGKAIMNMKDYMGALSELKPGDKAPITILRNGETLNLEVQF